MSPQTGYDAACLYDSRVMLIRAGLTVETRSTLTLKLASYHLAMVLVAAGPPQIAASVLRPGLNPLQSTMLCRAEQREC